MPWAVVEFGGSFLVFGVLARLWPCRRAQPSFLPGGMVDDILYFLFSLVAFGSLQAGLSTIAAPIVARLPIPAMPAGLIGLRGLPLVAQCLILLVASDLAQYWLHRALHGRALWPVHAVHHSSEHVSWLTAFRVHPINQIAYNLAVGATAALFGVAPLVFAVLVPVKLVHSLVVHANLDWTFGPFRYVLASPRFHRWHHADCPAAYGKNMAPTFPAIDLVFGTFHMPRDARPERFGCDDAPAHFVAQMLHPFATFAGRASVWLPSCAKRHETS